LLKISVCRLRNTLVDVGKSRRLDCRYLYINIKNCKALLKKVVIGRAVTALKQQKSKRKGEEKRIAEIVHLMKPITRSPDSSSNSSSSSSSGSSSSSNK
jgi:hypothetical protein